MERVIRNLNFRTQGSYEKIKFRYLKNYFDINGFSFDQEQHLKHF